MNCINVEVGLSLSSLSIADNALNDRKEFKTVLRSLLARQTGLLELDLSSNYFNSETLSSILFGLLENAELCVLKLENNTPPLTPREEDEINGALMRAKSQKISLWLLSGPGARDKVRSSEEDSTDQLAALKLEVKGDEGGDEGVVVVPTATAVMVSPPERR